MSLINNRRNRRNARKSQASSSPMEQMLKTLHTDLKELNRIQLNDMQGTLPRIPDVIPLKISRGKVYTVSVGVNLAVLTNSTTMDTAGTFVFHLGDLPQLSSYAAIFDAYQIQQVQVSFIPEAIGTNSTLVPPITTAIDYDNASTPGTLGLLLEYDSSATKPYGQTFTRTLNPRVAVATYAGAFTSYGQARPWIDTVSSSVNYYGLKYYWPLAVTSESYAVRATYIISFKNNL